MGNDFPKGLGIMKFMKICFNLQKNQKVETYYINIFSFFGHEVSNITPKGYKFMWAQHEV